MLSAPEGQQIRPLGFLNEDLIYGLIIDGDIAVSYTHLPPGL